MANAKGADSRISYQALDVEDMHSVYTQADCLVLPSRSEGWGMIHREAACSGKPVITQKYSGMDDGYTEKWALVLEPGEIRPIPKDVAFCLGDWMIADIGDLAQKMKWVYYSPETAEGFGFKAGNWLRKNQTWQHSAAKLVSLVEEHG
jgi:glycosyltransferase involved in cell wall biosynthesis